MFDLSEKVVLLTGTSRGIGKALAKGYAGAGASVVGCSRDGKGAKQTAQEIAAFGGRAIGVACDVTDEGQVQRLVSEALAAFGGLHVLHANAGIDITKPAGDFAAEEFTTIINGNLLSAFLCAKAVYPHFRNQGAGVITFTSSNASVAAFDELSPYCASKAGVDGLVRALATEWGRDNIRVNSINPGYTNHQMNPNSEAIMERLEEKIIERTPLRRVGRIEEMVGPSVFLASDAASYVSGVSLMVDGGWCAL